MATKRTKKTVVTGVTKEQANEAMGKFAALDAREQQITSKMDEQITKIREKYSDDLLFIAEQKEEAFAVVQCYATENREELFPKKKSIDTPHGLFGFRTGTPKLKTLKGFTWASVTNMLKEFLPDFVRVSEEANKQALLDSRDVPEVAEKFEKCGFVVDQDETFFIEVKKEEAATA